MDMSDQEISDKIKSIAAKLVLLDHIQAQQLGAYITGKEPPSAAESLVPISPSTPTLDERAK